jgi:hypothetical protein
MTPDDAPAPVEPERSVEPLSDEECADMLRVYEDSSILDAPTWVRRALARIDEDRKTIFELQALALKLQGHFDKGAKP